MDTQGTVALDPKLANTFAFSLTGPERDRDFVLDFVSKATEVNEERIPFWDEAQDNYFVTPTGQGTKFIVSDTLMSNLPLAFRANARHPRRSTLKDPELHQIIETLTAQAIGLLLNQRDYIQVVPVGADDYEKARILGRILTAILEQPGWYRTHYQLIKNAFIYGTAIVELSWEKRSRSQMTRIPQFDQLGRLLGYRTEPRDVVYKDAPLFREVDRYNFYPDPSGTRIQHDMCGVAKRFDLTKYAVQELARAGTYHYTDSVRRALESASGSRKSSRMGGQMRFPDAPKDIPDDFGRLVGYEYWGKVPYKTQDGATNRVITVLEDQTVRSHINPYIDGRIPFKEIVVNPVAGRFDGLAPTEVLRFLQDSADSMLMALTDAANLAVRPSIVVGTAFGGDPDEITRREELINARNPDAVKPLPVDLNALQFAGMELFRRKASMRETSGSNAQQLLSSEGGDRTATAASELVRLTSQRVELMVQLMERDDYPWIGQTLHSRLKQFLPPGGGRALFQGESMRFTLDQIDFEADVRFIGSRHNLTPFQIFSQYQTMASVLGTNPALAVTAPEILIRMFRDGLKIVDAERIVTEMGRQYQIEQARSVLLGSGKTGGGSVGDFSLPLGTESGAAEQEGQRLA